jgi:hypothetical protein
VDAAAALIIIFVCTPAESSADETENRRTRFEQRRNLISKFGALAVGAGGALTPNSSSQMRRAHYPFVRPDNVVHLRKPNVSFGVSHEA